MTKQTVIIASISHHKIDVASRIFFEFCVKRCKPAETLLMPKQPVGYEAGRICAHLCIKNVIAQLAGSRTTRNIKWIIAIKDYIDQSQGKWWESSVIVISNKKGVIYTESPPWSCKSVCSVALPSEYVHEARVDSVITDLGWSIPISDVVHNHHPNVPKSNWWGALWEYPQTVYATPVRVADRYIQLTAILTKTLEIANIRNALRKQLDADKDMTFFSNVKNFRQLIKLFINWIPTGTTHIVGFKTYGLILGSAVAFKKKLPFVPISLHTRTKTTLTSKNRIVLIDNVFSDKTLDAITVLEKCGVIINRIITLSVQDLVLDDIPHTVLF